MSDAAVATPPRRTRGRRFASVPPRRRFETECELCGAVIYYRPFHVPPARCSACLDEHSWTAAGGPEGGKRRRGELFTDQRTVLEVLGVDPLGVFAIASVTGLESPTVRHNLDQLVTRELATEIPGRPTTWRLAA